MFIFAASGLGINIGLLLTMGDRCPHANGHCPAHANKEKGGCGTEKAACAKGKGDCGEEKNDCRKENNVGGKSKDRGNKRKGKKARIYDLSVHGSMQNQHKISQVLAESRCLKGMHFAVACKS